MPDWLGIALLYAIGSVIFVAELFLPSHGLLGIVSVATLSYAVYRTFLISTTFGLISLAALAIFLPVGLIVAVRTWHRTPLGKRISPPNPVLGEEDRLPVEVLKAVIGQRGRAVTLLRPVGICDFNGQRLECKAEQNMIERGVEVEAIGMADRSLVVRPVPPSTPRDKC
jgi:membrane-bound ClpP family serine protease